MENSLSFINVLGPSTLPVSQFEIGVMPSLTCVDLCMEVKYPEINPAPGVDTYLKTRNDISMSHLLPKMIIVQRSAPPNRRLNDGVSE